MRAVAIARPFFKDLFAILLTIVEAVRAYYKFLPNHTRTMLINYLYKHIYSYIYIYYIYEYRYTFNTHIRIIAGIHRMSANAITP